MLIKSFEIYGFCIVSSYAKTTSQNSKAHYQNKNRGKSSIKHVNINRGKSLHKGLYRYVRTPCLAGIG